MSKTFSRFLKESMFTSQPVLDSYIKQGSGIELDPNIVLWDSYYDKQWSVDDTVEAYKSKYTFFKDKKAAAAVIADAWTSVAHIEDHKMVFNLPEYVIYITKKENNEIRYVMQYFRSDFIEFEALIHFEEYIKYISLDFYDHTRLNKFHEEHDEWPDTYIDFLASDSKVASPELKAAIEHTLDEPGLIGILVSDPVLTYEAINDNIDPILDKEMERY